nr:MAG: hypothetical protein [Apis mellifera filamentous virus]
MTKRPRAGPRRDGSAPEARRQRAETRGSARKRAAAWWGNRGNRGARSWEPRGRRARGWGRLTDAPPATAAPRAAEARANTRRTVGEKPPHHRNFGQIQAVLARQQNSS